MRIRTSKSSRGSANGNHGGRPKVIDDDMVTFAQALRDEGVPMPDIAAKLTIKTGCFVSVPIRMGDRSALSS